MELRGLVQGRYERGEGNYQKRRKLHYWVFPLASQWRRIELPSSKINVQLSNDNNGHSALT